MRGPLYPLYSDIIEQCCSNGWHAKCKTIEIGCAGQSLCSAYNILGTTGAHCIRMVMDAAETTSRTDLWGSRYMVSVHKLGLDQPWLSCLYEVVCCLHGWADSVSRYLKSAVWISICIQVPSAPASQCKVASGEGWLVISELCPWKIDGFEEGRAASKTEDWVSKEADCLSNKSFCIH